MKSPKRTMMGAPCGLELWDTDAREFHTEYPAVNCNFKCDFCGFNPNEQERRLSKGRLVMVHKIHKIRDDNGMVTDVVEKDCKAIHFSKEVLVNA